MIFLAAFLAFAPVAIPADRSTPQAAQRESVSDDRRAQALFVGLATNTLDPAALTPDLRAELTKPMLDSLARTLGPFGVPTRLTLRGKHDIDGITTFDYLVGVRRPTS